MARDKLSAQSVGYWVGAGLLLGSIWSCSASPASSGESGGSGGRGNTGGVGGNSTAGGSAGSSAGGNQSEGGFGGSNILDAGNSGGSGGSFDPDADTCAGELSQGQRVPLDMYIMMDTSGSMLSEVSSGVSKWDAVRGALQGFLQSSESAGLGVGIQYFPQLKSGAAWSCNSNADCGTGGSCFLKTCNNTTGIYPCNSNLDCPLGGSCVNLGECPLAPGYVCTPIGSSITGCGVCQAFTQPSSCLDPDSCLVGDYTTPAVTIASLPGNTAALVDSLNATTPHGNTPTGPALQGAIDQARNWAGSHPGHTVITVLVTDGAPTSCNPTNINQIASLASSALAGSPSIQTFVIGVFEPSDTTGQNNVNTIASAGGTGTAFVVDGTASDLGSQFAQALEAIRGTALSCEYSIPAPSEGELDYGKVNVEFEDAGNKVTIPYVGDVGSCDPVQGGWYYNVNPSSGTPSTVIMCPTTCDQFTQASNAAAVNVRLGCKRSDIIK